MKKTRVCALLGVEYPVIMGALGGIATGALAAAVSNAGGLGSVATAFASVDQVRQEIEKCKALTDKPFAVNVPLWHPEAEEVVDAILQEGVRIVSTSAGPPDRLMSRLKDAAVKTMHVVPNVRGAVRAAQAGVDVVIASGIESGGMASRDEITTLVLIPQVVDAVSIPVVAAGGIADGRGFLAALALGAEGVQMGTAFLATTECDRVSQTYKQVLINTSDAGTGIAARRLSPSRMVKNRFFDAVEELDQAGKREELQLLLRSRRSMTEDDPENGMFGCGQVAGLIREVKTIRDLIQGIMREAEEVYGKLA